MEMPWGKHRGKTLAEVVAADPAYITWLRRARFVADKFPEVLEAIAQAETKMGETASMVRRPCACEVELIKGDLVERVQTASCDRAHCLEDRSCCPLLDLFEWTCPICGNQQLLDKNSRSF